MAEFLILPLVVLYAIEVMLPSTSFTFRVWEAIGSKSGFLLGPFYPNIDINYIEVGDLVPHSEFAIEKKCFGKRISWVTGMIPLSRPQISYSLAIRISPVAH